MELCPTGPLYLELGNGFSSIMERFSDKTTSLGSTSAMDVVVLRGRYCRFIDTQVPAEEIHDVLRMASCLPNLKRLSLWRLRVPLTAITTILQYHQSQSQNHNHHPLLEELELRSIILSGSMEDMRDLAMALQRHASLTKISLADCRPEGTTTTTTPPPPAPSLDPLFMALGNMPQLRQVELDMMELSRWCQSVTSFQHLFVMPQKLQQRQNENEDNHDCRSEGIKALSLSYMRLPEDYILAMAQALVDNNNYFTTSTSTITSRMEELCLDRCDSLSPQSVRVMGQMLRHNTSLIKLQLVVKQYHDAIPIAQALHQDNDNTASNSRLRQLLLRCYHHHYRHRRLRHPQDDGDAGHGGNNNNDTTTTTSTTTTSMNMSPAVYHAFRDMLQHNYQLRQLEFFQGHPILRPLLDLDPPMNFYLKLNRAGRAKLFLRNRSNHKNHHCSRTSFSSSSSSFISSRNKSKNNNNEGEAEASNEEWIQTIIACRSDLECCFYFLSQNPSVLSTAGH